MKKSLKIALFSLIIFIILLIAGNLSFNFFLQNQLPNYIAEKSPYKVQYANLKVDIWSGDIIAENINIDNKDPKNKEIIVIKGTVDSLQISRLGMMDAVLNKKINTSEIILSQPNLHIRLAKPIDAKTGEKRNPIVFKDLKINKGNINIVKFNENPFFSVKNLDVEVNNFQLTEESVKNKLPVVFDSYNISGKDFFFRPDNVYEMKANDISTENGKMNVKGFQLKPIINFQTFTKTYPNKKSLFSVDAKELDFKDIVRKDNKLSFKNIDLINPDIQVFTNNNKTTQKKQSFSYELDLENLNVVNGSFRQQDLQNKLLSFNTFNLKINQIKVDEQTANGNIPFSYKNYDISLENFFSDADEFYTYSIKKAIHNNNSAKVFQFSMTPKYSRSVFNKMIPYERDLFTITANYLDVNGLQWKLEKDKPNIDIKNIVVDRIHCNIFRSSYPVDDTTDRVLYATKLRNINFPIFVENLAVRNSYLEYEEDNANGNPAGKLIFNNFNVNAKNINSLKTPNKPTQIVATVTSQFMNVAPLQATWKFDTKDMNDSFTMVGSIQNLPAEKVNLFIKPYLNLTANGTFRNINFDFYGNDKGIKGVYAMKHENIKVNVLDKKTKEKKKLLSAIVNLVVKNDSKKIPEKVNIDVPRDRQRSFFNLFWKGIEQGLKETIIL